MLNCACRDFYNVPRCTPTGLCAPSRSPPIRCAKLCTLHAWTGDWRPTDQIKHCMCFETVFTGQSCVLSLWSRTRYSAQNQSLIIFTIVLVCEIDCAVQTRALMLVSLMGSLGLSLLSTQAKKEKLQQAGDRNFE